jgi:hypothetical protein
MSLQQRMLGLKPSQVTNLLELISSESWSVVYAMVIREIERLRTQLEDVGRSQREEDGDRGEIRVLRGILNLRSDLMATQNNQLTTDATED